MSDKHFQFGVEMQRAFKTPDGKMRVVGIASDDDYDRVGDRMSEKAISSMVEQSKKNRIPLLESHKSTFGFGYTVDADVRKVKDERGKTLNQYVVEFELDERYPQAQDLFDEVADGTSKKQLSIGGFINTKNKNAVAVEYEGDKKRRRIDEVYLDHVATTRPGMAAVPRTKFVDAIVKDVFGDDADLPDDWRIELARSVGDAVAAAVADGADEDGIAKAAGAAANGAPVIVVAMPAPAPKTNELQKTEPDPNPAADAAPQERNQMADTSKSSQAPVEAKDEDKTADAVTKSAEQAVPALSIKGLEALARISKAFEDEKPKDEVQDEVKALTKSFSEVENLELTAKSANAIRRMRDAMTRLLGDVAGEEAETPTPAFKSEEIAGIVEKAVATAIGNLTNDGNSAAVIETFEKSFSGLTEELAKGLVSMGQGFSQKLDGSVADMKAQVEGLEKSFSDRIQKLEQAGGVRQSVPVSDALANSVEPVAKSAPARTAPARQSAPGRAPDASNPFRGAFDRARNEFFANNR